MSFSVLGNPKSKIKIELDKLEAKHTVLKQRLNQLADVSYINRLRDKMSDDMAMLERLRSEHQQMKVASQATENEIKRQQKVTVAQPGSDAGITGLLNLIEAQNQRQTDLKKHIDAARLAYEKNTDHLEEQREKYQKLVTLANHY